jgi:anti-sigma28 factor (negative regulator of flagellin synthesis)
VLPHEQLEQLRHKLREESPGSPEREAYLEQLAEQIRTGSCEVDTEQLARILAEKLFSELD